MQEETEVLVNIPKLDYMEVVLDFRQIDEDGTFSVTYEPSDKFSNETIRKEVTEFVNGVIEVALEDDNDQ